MLSKLLLSLSQERNIHRIHPRRQGGLWLGRPLRKGVGAAQHALGPDHHPDGFGRQPVGRVGRGSDCHTARQPPHPVVRSERAADRPVAPDQPAGPPSDGIVGGLD